MMEIVIWTAGHVSRKEMETVKIGVLLSAIRSFYKMAIAIKNVMFSSVGTIPSNALHARPNVTNQIKESVAQTAE